MTDTNTTLMTRSCFVVQYLYMTIEMMHKLLDISSYVYIELTDDMSDREISKNFWKFLKSKFLDNNTKKIKVSDYVYDELLKFDVQKFNAKYNCKLENVKKSKSQLSFVCSSVALMLKHSSVGDNIIDWC